MGPKSFVIDGRIHMLRDPPQHADLVRYSTGNRPQRRIYRSEVSGRQRILYCGDGIEDARCDRFDLDVHQDEPMFVIEVNEILNRVEVAERCLKARSCKRLGRSRPSSSSTANSESGGNAV